MIFRDKNHEEMYKDLCSHTHNWLRNTLAYLITLDDVLREHVEIRDFYSDEFLKNVLYEEWHTELSLITLRLALNLCFHFTSNPDGSCGFLYTPSYIFFNSVYAPYYWEAIKLCFEYEEVKEI